jgi:hypothetical protein
MTTLPKGPTSNILVNLQGLSDPIGYTLRMRKRYGDPMSLPKMDGKPVLATGSVEGLRALFAAPTLSVGEGVAAGQARPPSERRRAFAHRMLTGRG